MRATFYIFLFIPFINCIAESIYEIESVSVDKEKNQWFMPQESGWLAGDVAHSIQLDSNRILWIFGDTWPGTYSDDELNPEQLYVHNSIAIQYLNKDRKGRFEFIFGKFEEGRSFFPQVGNMPGKYLWPTNGLILNNELYVFCQAVSHDETGWFGIAGTVIIRVQNFKEHPSKWIKKYFDFRTPAWKDNTMQVQYHSALFQQDEFIYFLGFKAEGNSSKKQAILSRVDTLTFIQKKSSIYLEHFIGKNTDAANWSSNFNDAVVLFEPGNTESNIQYISEWGLFVTTTYSAIDNKILLTYANELTGPWAKPEIVYENPIINCPERVCIETYAVRPHPEFSQSIGEIIISYITSYTGDYKKAPLVSYRPRFIRLVISKK
ncbi:MAG: hypothetical protein CMG74_12115 [Candidatus Marinimicrobia bacterium]|nr:hypothetical protein [Candidatus Neomarinimicrobiota bacterium]|tara:strand:- start:8560 stop:9690 length:1131 start_codon:yes stop_codon:yes gene_type:complete